MIVATCGVIIAHADPWATRATISTAPLGASPQASEAIVKPPRPSMNSRRCP
jgi:hypothetical protein